MTKEVKIMLGIAALIIAAGIVLVLKSPTTDQSGNAVADPSLLVHDDSDRKGNKDAKVTVVEFADFECPACGSSYPTTKKIVSEYSDRINFVFRNFPLPQHNTAPLAAQAALAAGEQGKFWEMHDILYERQNDWAEKANAFDMFAGYAQELGLDVNKFKESVQSNKFKSKVDRDIQDANALGVNATPTFFINGVMHPGILSEEDFKEFIEQELSKQQ